MDRQRSSRLGNESSSKAQWVYTNFKNTAVSKWQAPLVNNKSNQTGRCSGITQIFPNLQWMNGDWGHSPNPLPFWPSGYILWGQKESTLFLTPKRGLLEELPLGEGVLGNCNHMLQDTPKKG